MIIASENIVNELFEHNDNKPLSSIMSIREIYFTGYLEGAQISVQDAMTFLQSGEEPHDVEELMILNNRQAGSFAAENLYRPLNEEYIKALAQILTNGLDNGGGELRATDSVDIYSMQGENYVLPSSARLNGCVKEISAFLADLSIHPLIKSAAAQAWTMVVRPFPEGNERLGRLLSEIILVRSGYTFFGEDSVSAVIAKNGFKYFDSIAKSIRSDNGGDLTYFIEYYLSVLSAFVDEYMEKRKKSEEEIIESEKGLAKAPLADTANRNHTAIADSDRGKHFNDIRVVLCKLQDIITSTQSSGKKALAKALKELLLSGKYEFTVRVLYDHLTGGIPLKTVYNNIQQLMEDNIIKISRKIGPTNYYSFCIDNTEPEDVRVTESGIDYTAIYNAIYPYTMDMHESTRKISDALIRYLKNERYSFTASEMEKELNVSINTIYNHLRRLISINALV